MFRYNDYARMFFLLFLSLVLVICFGTHDQDNDAIREDNFKGVFCSPFGYLIIPA